MPRQRVITQEKFDDLLAWLHRDREQAGIKYEEIRRSLIRILAWRGCSDAEGLADETINRVADRVHELKVTYSGDRAAYFYGVVNRLIKECQREARAQVPVEDVSGTSGPAPEAGADQEDDFAREYDCLLACLERLSPDKRELILAYYQEEKQAKIDHRKELARRLGLDANALRVRAHRIRAALEECIARCLERPEADEMD
ncbi:MAG TPA: sigma-70 family RNA polymerase sigma factor [Pyrinomonadaceae bacterium]|jgi:RNA polymerase sigma factor (sigma-70 family)